MLRHIAAVSALLTLMVGPLAAEDDVLQKALNYIFLGDTDKSGVTIVDRDACVIRVVSMSGSFEQKLYLRSIKEADVYQKPDGQRYLAIEGDNPVLEETKWPGTNYSETTKGKKGFIRIVGTIERTRNALKLVFSEYCPPETTKLPF